MELSFEQEMVWLLEQINPEAMFYNVVERFGGSQDNSISNSCDRCIDKVIERHNILRTIYPVIANHPMQRVQSRLIAARFKVIDLREFTDRRS